MLACFCLMDSLFQRSCWTGCGISGRPILSVGSGLNPRIMRALLVKVPGWYQALTCIPTGSALLMISIFICCALSIFLLALGGPWFSFMLSRFLSQCWIYNRILFALVCLPTLWRHCLQIVCCARDNFLHIWDGWSGQQIMLQICITDWLFWPWVGVGTLEALTPVGPPIWISWRYYCFNGVLLYSLGVLFQLQMRISFPFLLAKYLRRFLLITRTLSFFNLLYAGGKYARLVYTWYKNISHMIAVLIVFLAANEKKESDENNIKTRQQ